MKTIDYLSKNMLSGDMFEASFLHEGEENPERIFFGEAV